MFVELIYVSRLRTPDLRLKVKSYVKLDKLMYDCLFPGSDTV